MVARELELEEQQQQLTTPEEEQPAEGCGARKQENEQQEAAETEAMLPDGEAEEEGKQEQGQVKKEQVLLYHCIHNLYINTYIHTVQVVYPLKKLNKNTYVIVVFCHVNIFR